MRPMQFLASFTLVLLLGLAALTSNAGPANAAKLDTKTCSDLKLERDKLKTHETVKAMQKGFEWVKENIKSDELTPIRDFIEVNEKLKFQCSTKNPADKKLPPTQVAIKVQIDLPVKKPEGSDEENPPPAKKVKAEQKAKSPAKKAGDKKQKKPVKATPKKKPAKKS